MLSLLEIITRNGNQVLRLGALASFLIALILFLRPDEHWEAEADRIAVLIVALAVWIWQEIVTFPRLAAHPHDLQLMTLVMERMGDRELRFLRDQDLGASFKVNDAVFLFDITDNWKGVFYEFQDLYLQEAFGRWVQNVRDLTIEIALMNNSQPDNFMSLVPEGERDWFSHGTRKRIDSLNNETSRLGVDFEAFVRLARERIPEAFATKRGHD